MINENRQPDPVGQPLNTAHIYALLTQLSMDLKRLEKLVRAMKHNVEEKQNEHK